MHVPGSRLLTLLLAAALLVTGCGGGNSDANRSPGDAITPVEAQVLADVLHRNVEEGGADVTITAEYAEGALLTMTGSVDFATKTGTMDTKAEFTSDQPDEIRTIYFDSDRLIVGGLPGLTAAMASAARDGVQYLRSDLDQQGRLIDNIVGMLLRLTADKADDPDNLIAAGYTWQGAIRIDSILTNTYGRGKTLISVGVEDKLLHQFVSPPSSAGFPVQITLTEHGPRTIDFPPEDQIADASAYPEVAAECGF